MYIYDISIWRILITTDHQISSERSHLVGPVLGNLGEVDGVLQKFYCDDWDADPKQNHLKP